MSDGTTCPTLQTVDFQLTDRLQGNGVNAVLKMSGLSKSALPVILLSGDDLDSIASASGAESNTHSMNPLMNTCASKAAERELH
jgi:hypothetical protein